MSIFEMPRLLASIEETDAKAGCRRNVPPETLALEELKRSILTLPGARRGRPGARLRPPAAEGRPEQQDEGQRHDRAHEPVAEEDPQISLRNQHRLPEGVFRPVAQYKRQ